MVDDLTCDAFLGGRVMLWQPRRGYRAAIDAVLLAASVPARPGETVLDLGCGAGAAGLCLAARVPGVQVTGIERQSPYADLARRNGLTVIEADLSALSGDLRSRSFDQVMMNPPYFRRNPAVGAQDPGREAALAEATPLPVWLDVAVRRLRPGGWLTAIHRAARLADLLAALDGRTGSVRILPVAPRNGQPALHVIVRARKGGRAALALLAPLVLHDGDRHPGDHDHFTPLARAILRDGAAVPGFD